MEVLEPMASGEIVDDDELMFVNEEAGVCCCCCVCAKDVEAEDDEMIDAAAVAAVTEDVGGNGEMLSFNLLNSSRNLRLTRVNLDCARTPMTSAYRSVTY